MAYEKSESVSDKDKLTATIIRTSMMVDTLGDNNSETP